MTITKSKQTMISFYPGPSRVHDEIPEYVRQACDKGILSINHRSDEFMEMSRETISLLKSKLEIPVDYTILFTTSATECWEIIAQSVIDKGSFHFFNGAFGKKWFEYTRKLCSNAIPFPFDADSLINAARLALPDGGDVICLTQNETSNGTQIHSDIMLSFREGFPQHLIAVDATSSMAGIRLDFTTADIWFASVQKCFGLPAGLALMICSPAAIRQVRRIGENRHYNSLTFIADMMDKWQTPFTPNVLNIYLLNRVLAASKPIADVHKEVEERYHKWTAFLKQKKSFEHLIHNEDARSLTVLTVKSKEELVTEIKSRAKRAGLLLGEGYGDLKTSTFRIANFPAIKDEEIKTLMEFLTQYE